MRLSELLDKLLDKRGIINTINEQIIIEFIGLVEDKEIHLAFYNEKYFNKLVNYLLEENSRFDALVKLSNLIKIVVKNEIPKSHEEYMLSQIIDDTITPEIVEKVLPVKEMRNAYKQLKIGKAECFIDILLTTPNLTDNMGYGPRYRKLSLDQRIRYLIIIKKYLMRIRKIFYISDSLNMDLIEKLNEEINTLLNKYHPHTTLQLSKTLKTYKKTH